MPDCKFILASEVDLNQREMFTGGMDLINLTPNQLKRAASIKEQIDRLNRELSKLVGSASNNGARHGRLSLARRRRLGAAQRARWAKMRKAKAEPIVKSVVKKTKMSAAARARVSARMKRYWKAKKAGKKTASTKK
jgi:polyhydroxyalkanoate synthesis regulator phasin